MKMLLWLHRWTGGIVGILLAIVGLSGTALLWEDGWVMVPGAGDPVLNDPAALGRAIAAADAAGPDLSRVTFASEEIGLHQAIYADGSGAYITQTGAIVERWSDMWERPELWLFDLHHYLFMGDIGKTLTGILGFLLLGFSLTGLLLWWRTRKTFRFRIWPARLTASSIIRHHRDLGAVASPLLILAALTGSMMIFPAVSSLLLSPFSSESQAPSVPDNLASPDNFTDWPTVIARGQAEFPTAIPRRLTMPSEPGAPLALRLKQDFEWTPNGRTYAWIDPISERVVASEDPARGDVASAVAEKYYPVHAAKVGGFPWRIAMTFAGLALAMLGLFASWSFWTGKARSKDHRRVTEKRIVTS